jgi:type VI secretion system secreted protein VgrG
VLIKNTETRKIGTNTSSEGRKTDIKNGDEILTIDMGNQETTLKMGNQTTTLNMGNQETNVKLGYIKETAMQKIELICGASKITMTPASIDIESIMVNIKGQALVDVKGTLTTVKGDAILTLKGGLTLIN